MFGHYYLRRDLNICIDDKFNLLPSITFSKTGKFFEVKISFLIICLYLCYSTNNFDDD